MLSKEENEMELASRKKMTLILAIKAKSDKKRLTIVIIVK